MDGITTITIDMNTVQSGTRIDFLYTLDEVNNATGDLYIYDNEGGLTYLENSLPAVTIHSNLTARFNGGIIQSSVYWNSKYYEAFRDKQNTKALDDFQSSLDVIGTIDPTGIVDGVNAIGYLARGQKANAMIAAIAILPLGDLAKGVKYTKSTMAIGQEMHKAYKVGEEGIKEFRLISGKRIDFLDIENGVIYELKPYNPRAMKAGEKQLNTYLKEITSPEMLQKHPELMGIQWKTVLETY